MAEQQQGSESLANSLRAVLRSGALHHTVSWKYLENSTCWRKRKILLLFTPNQEITEHLNQRANGVYFAITINYRGQWIPLGHIKFIVV